jgi:hypothetical protein
MSVYIQMILTHPILLSGTRLAKLQKLKEWVLSKKYSCPEILYNQLLHEGEVVTNPDRTVQKQKQLIKIQK